MKIFVSFNFVVLLAYEIFPTTNFSPFTVYLLCWWDIGVVTAVERSCTWRINVSETESGYSLVERCRQLHMAEKQTISCLSSRMSSHFAVLIQHICKHIYTYGTFITFFLKFFYPISTWTTVAHSFKLCIHIFKFLNHL